MRPESQRVVDEVLAYMHRFAGETSLSAVCDEAFDALARRIFAYQFEHNPLYRRYCQARRRTPHTVRRWQDIPPVPIQAFKEGVMSVEPPEKAVAVFMTSGTTRPDRRGRNFHPSLAVWEASMRTGFRRFVLPESAVPGGRMTMFVLSPGDDEMPNSSLAHYFTVAVQTFGRADSRFFFRAGRLDVDAFLDAVAAAHAAAQPVMVLGATFAYAHVVDALRARGVRAVLPPGSLVFDTGGMKGHGRELRREAFHAWMAEWFGVTADRCINMYGMTELSSQLYDQTLCTNGAVRDKTGPAWVRTLILHPDTLVPLPEGETGVIAHYDLANWNAAVAILTEDLGVRTPHGFELIGRIAGSEARGCSAAIDEVLQAARETAGDVRG